MRFLPKCGIRTDSSIAATRQRRFGTVQPPDISRIGHSIFPPLFPTKQTPVRTEDGGGRLPRSLSISKVNSRGTTESSRKNPPPDTSQKELRLPQLSPGHVSLQSQGLAKGSQRQSTSRAADESVAPKSRHDLSEPPMNRKPTQQAKANRCASCNRKTGLSNSYTCSALNRKMMVHMDGQTLVTVQTIEKDTGEDIPGDVKRRDASVIIKSLGPPCLKTSGGIASDLGALPLEICCTARMVSGREGGRSRSLFVSA
ncbi:unnamed protein product [Schistocephalus solidus]|uniref:Uncharacterized protein n=1 Tax=Schistocephalus solidus TaxID=70667 RepID=A0A183SV18_SCHSO|nr:unnamed protein product [Schistocephalus solidus]